MYCSTRNVFLFVTAELKYIVFRSKYIYYMRVTLYETVQAHTLAQSYMHTHTHTHTHLHIHYKH